MFRLAPSNSVPITLRCPSPPRSTCREMVPKILNYVETQKDTSLPVIKFRGPEELEEAFNAVGK